MESIEIKRDEAVARRVDLEHELHALGDITTSENPGAWVRKRDDLRLAIASARADELRAELALLECESAEVRDQQPDARADVELIEAELKVVQKRLNTARRAAGALQYQLNLNTDRRRRLQRELDGILSMLRNEAEGVNVKALNVH